jgi:Xaa-Pro dipeptidase
MTAGVGGSTAELELATLAPPPGRPPAIDRVEYEVRLTKAHRLMATLGADALIVGAGASLHYSRASVGAPPNVWWR